MRGVGCQCSLLIEQKHGSPADPHVSLTRRCSGLRCCHRVFSNWRHISIFTLSASWLQLQQFRSSPNISPQPPLGTRCAAITAEAAALLLHVRWHCRLRWHSYRALACAELTRFVAITRPLPLLHSSGRLGAPWLGARGAS